MTSTLDRYQGGSVSDTGIIRVLLIEDNPGDAQLIRIYLTTPNSNEFRVQAESTLHAGLNSLHNADFDVVLLDLSLPDSFGFDSIQRLRKEQPNIPIVVFTGLDDEEAGVQAVQAGAQDYLIKGSVDTTLLKRSLRYAIERYRSEQELRQSREEYRSLIVDVFNSSTVGVVILDSMFKVVWVNDALLTYFGLRREDVVGHDKRVLVMEKLKCLFQDADTYEKNLLDSYEAHSYSTRFECLVLPKDGVAERWLEYWSQPVSSGLYAGGRIEHYTDITARKNAELAEREQRNLNDALRDAAALLTNTLNLDEVLDRILETLERAVVYNKADIILLDDNEAFVARSTSRYLDGADESAQRLYLLDQTPFLRQMLQDQTHLLSNNIHESHLWDGLPEVARFGSYLGTPIIAQNRVIGFISIYSQSFNQYDEIDIERLQSFAGYAAIAIQNARLYRASLQLAAFQERQRLARELHDSVSQTLFTSSVMSESALRQWSLNPEKAQRLLTDVHQLIKGALAEMRVLLLELRPRSLEQANLRYLLELQAQAIQGRNSLNIHLQIDDLPELPADVKVSLYRITQEALNNVVKHSTATNVDIAAQLQGDAIVLRITDDGQGFDIEQVPGSSLGLGIMRERADTINASLQLDSTVGEGTTVTVRWQPNANDE
ncbi:MAG: response regulator [Anaerolineae bacterium]|nr:response regulator [Anaerolineae bacterium]